MIGLQRIRDHSKKLNGESVKFYAELREENGKYCAKLNKENVNFYTELHKRIGNTDREQLSEESNNNKVELVADDKLLQICVRTRIIESCNQDHKSTDNINSQVNNNINDESVVNNNQGHDMCPQETNRISNWYSQDQELILKSKINLAQSVVNNNDSRPEKTKMN